MTSFIIRRVIIILLLSIFTFPLSAQILNIDRENNQDTLKKILKAFITVSFSSDKQKNNFLEFTNASELNYSLKKNYSLILLGHMDIAFNGPKTIENNGYVQLRFRDNDTRKISPESYIQYQWNGVLGLQNRSLAGCNARLRLLDKYKGDLYIGVGIFYEIERWNINQSAYSSIDDTVTFVNRKMFRLNVPVKFAFKISDKIDFSCISYMQLPLNSNFNQPRWFFDSNLYFEFSKHFNFLIHYDHTYDTYRALPIENYYYSLNIGIQLKI